MHLDLIFSRCSVVFIQLLLNNLQRLRRIDLNAAFVCGRLDADAIRSEACGVVTTHKALPFGAGLFPYARADVEGVGAKLMEVFGGGHSLCLSLT